MTASSIRTRAQAEQVGMLVDVTCYPWVAYVGERHNPINKIEIMTDLEAELFVELQALVARHPDTATRAASLLRRLK